MELGEARGDRLCVVCYEPTSDHLKSCGHLLCGSCAVKWFAKRVVCPICIAVPYATTVRRPVRDGEHDVIVLTFPLGLVLMNRSDSVLVKSTHAKDSAHRSGVRHGDTITFVNDIPVCRHADAIGVIRAAEQRNVPVVLTIRRARRACCHFRCF
jgi:hypothetical protein